MDGGVWWATVHWVTKSRTQLSYFTFTFFILILKMEEKKQQFWHIMLDYVKKGKNTTDTKKKRHRYKEQTFGLCGRRQGWDDLRE